MLLTMPETDVTQLKVADLKRELKSRGLSIVGNKIELQDRLQVALLEGDTVLDDSAIAEDIQDDEDGLIDDDLDDEVTKSILANKDDVLLESTDITKKSVPEVQPIKKVILKRNQPIVINALTESNHNPEDIPKKRKLSGDLVITTGATTRSFCESDDTSTKKVVTLSKLSLEERLEMRTKKFGSPQVESDSKKVVRAERFGVATKQNNNNLEITKSPAPSSEILKKRAERFGVTVSSALVSSENNEKLLQRKERFGVSEAKPIVNYSEKARQRLERFKTTTT